MSTHRSSARHLAVFAAPFEADAFPEIDHDPRRPQRLAMLLVRAHVGGRGPSRAALLRYIGNTIGPTLTIFRINTYEKHRGRGLLRLTS